MPSNRLFLSVMFISLLIFIAIPAYSGVLYVTEDGTGDGTSWDQAFGDPQEAIELNPVPVTDQRIQSRSYSGYRPTGGYENADSVVVSTDTISDIVYGVSKITAGPGRVPGPVYHRFGDYVPLVAGGNESTMSTFALAGEIEMGRVIAIGHPGVIKHLEHLDNLRFITVSAGLKMP